MKTKTIFLFLILIACTANVKAQIGGKKFELSVEQMGTFVCEFTETEYVVTTLAGDTIVTGNFEIADNTISFKNEKGPQSCPEGNVGNYTFSFKDKILKMELLEDNCNGRPNIITQVWKEMDE